MAPTDPQGPGGGGNPPDPGLTNKMEALKDGVTVTDQLLSKIEDHLARATTRADELGKRFKNINLELSTAVTLAGDTEEAVKEISAAAKTLRKGILDTKSSKDALATVTAIHKAQAILLDKTKQMPAAQARVKRQMQDMQMWMEKLSKTTGTLADDEMLKLQKVLHQIAKEGENVSKIFKGIQVDHLTRQITGISGALKTMGICKAYHARVEKYEGYGAAAKQIREAQKARFEGNKDMFKDKRDAALAAVREKYGVSMSDPRALRMMGKGQRGNMQAEVAKSMGLNTKGWTQKDWSAFGGGTPTATVTSAMERYHGTGATKAASMLATGTEGGLATLGEAMAAAAPALAALEGAVMLLVEAFDGYVAQNKAMESGLAKGGLFSGATGGRGFTGARAGLTPDSAYTRLGLSFDRNLKIAQTIAEQGYAIQDIVAAGQQEEMTGVKTPGRAGEGFMAGASGMIQRAVVGAGRIAGLTDAEGVQRVVKLMEEYRETLEQGENFFMQVTKGAKSAGLSTTKYISILDEVMGRFDRMNRSLDQTVQIMDMLGKSGRLAGEDMQQYLKFLTGGAGAPENAGTSEQIFLFNRMSASSKANLASNQQQLMTNLVDRAVGTGGRPGELSGIPGITPEMMRKGFGGSARELDDFVTNVVQPAIATANVDPGQKKSWNNLVEQMRTQKQQAETYQDFAKGKIDAVGLGLGTKVGGTNMSASMALQQGAMDMILKSGKFQDFKKNPMEFAAQHKEVSFLAELFKNDPKALQQLPRIMEIAGQQRLEAAQAGSKDDELYKLAVKKGFKINLQDPSAYSKWLKQNGNSLLNDIDGLHSTFSFFATASTKQQHEATENERRQALEEAKKVGSQTQTMADMIGHVFSKWFNNIISGLEAIIDLMPGGDSAARAQRKQDAQNYLTPQGKNAKDTTYALTTLQERIDEQTDMAEKANIAGDSKAEKMHKNAATVLQDQFDRVVAMQDAGTFFGQTDEDAFRAFIMQNTGATAEMARKRIANAQMTGQGVAGTGGNTYIDNSTKIGVDASTAPTQPPTAGRSKEVVKKMKPPTTVVGHQAQ
jgi:hypothetical protein